MDPWYGYTRGPHPIRGEKEQCLSWATISDYSYCRETRQSQQEQEKGKIGGPGKIVQINESKLEKHKCNKGCRVEEHWVLGLIGDGSENLQRLDVCPEKIRSAAELIPFIQKHFEIGTTIHTDCWKACDCLDQYGYIHKKVNHSDPDNTSVAEDGTHTQHMVVRVMVKRFFSMTPL